MTSILERQYFFNKLNHGLLVLEYGEGIELFDKFGEMNIGIFFEMIHDHVDIEYIITCFLLICDFEFIGEDLVGSLIEYLIGKLH